MEKKAEKMASIFRQVFGLQRSLLRMQCRTMGKPFSMFKMSKAPTIGFKSFACEKCRHHRNHTWSALASKNVTIASDIPTRGVKDLQKDFKNLR